MYKKNWIIINTIKKLLIAAFSLRNNKYQKFLPILWYNVNT